MAQQITIQEERRLIKAAHAGDRTAVAALVKAHTPFITRQVYRRRDSRGLFEDQMQVALMGFLYGLTKFDLSREVRLLTYCVHYINVYIQNYDRDAHRPMKIATTQERRSLLNSIPGTTRYLHRKLNREPTNGDIAAFLGKTEEQIVDMKICIAPVGQLNENIVPSEQESAEDTYAREELRWELRKHLNKFIARQHTIDKAILRYRLLADADDRETLNEVGKRFDLSRERIRQREHQLLVSLKRWMQPIQNETC